VKDGLLRPPASNHTSTLSPGFVPVTSPRMTWYQRLVLSGWSHRKLALHAYVLMLVSAACALVAQRQDGSGRWAIICGCVAVLLALFAVLELRFPRAASPSLPGMEP